MPQPTPRDEATPTHTGDRPRARHEPGTATLVIKLPGSVRMPTETPAVIEWLSAHGAPRTAEVLTRLQRDGWTIITPDPDTATQTALWATASFADAERACAAARTYEGRVAEALQWAPAERPGAPNRFSSRPAAPER